jgi:hypothetical protein
MAMAENGYDTAALPGLDPNAPTAFGASGQQPGHLHETAKLPTIQELLPPFDSGK